MKKRLIVTVLCFGSVAAPARAQEALATPILNSASNFRDIAGISAANGGSGYEETTMQGGVMRQGVFYRSNALTLNVTDLAAVASLRVRHDIDLRTPGEIASTPDAIIPGAIYTNINILGTSGPALVSKTLTDAASAKDYMMNMYVGFVTDPVLRAGFRAELLMLARSNGPVIVHCSSGKDRTGWSFVLLQTIAGIAPDVIRRDYLASNSYSDVDRTLSKLPPSTAAIMTQLLGVQASFLQASLSAVKTKYGTMDTYLKEGLGLVKADIEALRAKMVYYPTQSRQDVSDRKAQKVW